MANIDFFAKTFSVIEYDALAKTAVIVPNQEIRLVT